MRPPVLLSPVEQSDPRPDLDERALTIASRNAFPVVASRVARRDGMGLAAGAIGALLLGGVTFWSMAGNRESKPAPVALAQNAAPAPPGTAPLPADRPAGAPVPAVMPSRPLANPAATTDRAHSPIMVFDTSLMPSPAVAPMATTGTPPAGGKTANAPGQGLSDTEAFGARIGAASVDMASATPMADPANTITQGTLISAVLETAIDSDLPGYVRAIVSQDVRSFDGSRILIPRSSRLIGQYKSGLSAGQTRTYVLWSRLIRPDGASVAIASPATDFAGRTGLTGEVNSHFMKRMGGAMLLSVVGGLGAIASGGTSVVLSGGQSAASVAAQRDAQIPPTIRVGPGQPIRVFTARDLDFSTVEPR